MHQTSKHSPDLNSQEEDYFGYYYHAPGVLPGTLEIASDAKPSCIDLLDYNTESVTHRTNLQPEDCLEYLQTDNVTWFDVQGLGTEDILNNIGKVFNLHRLLLENVVNVPQRPKCEDYSDQLLIISQVVRINPGKNGFETEQVSLLVGEKYMITFQEDASQDPFKEIKSQICQKQGNIRSFGIDYLAYRVIDCVIESYFPVLEHYEDRIELLEEKIISSPSRKDLEQIYKIRRELLALRRLIWPLRDMLGILTRTGYDKINMDVQIYFRDCYDHVIQLLEITESYRELASSLMEVYLSAISNKVNDVMKLLTIISTIFIPLTFIAGLYGMNFEYMPELKSHWGYFICLSVMVLIALYLVFFFWRKGWFKSFY
jgi:magnesium transporter